MKRSLIYKITNLLNNKIYIGKYSRNTETKYFMKFEYYWGSGTYITRAIKKYGKENFKKEIIVEGDFNREFLADLEKHYIQLYNSTNPKIGYNLTIGGDGGTSVVVTAETRKKISAFHLGKSKPREQVLKSIATRQKLIYQFGIDGVLHDVWKSGKDIEDTLGICRKGISQCALNKINTFHNYIWVFNPETISERVNNLWNNKKSLAKIKDYLLYIEESLPEILSI